MGKNGIESGQSSEKAKELRASIQLAWYRLLDTKDDITDFAGDLAAFFSFSFTFSRGLKKRYSLWDSKPEERWGSQALQDTERWLLEQGVNRGVAICIPLGIYAFNHDYQKPWLHRESRIAIAGSSSKDGVKVVVYYPSLLADDKKVLTEMEEKFKSDVQPPAEFKIDLSVAGVLVGDKSQTISSADAARKKAQEAGHKFIGVYEKDWEAELSTICNPGYAARIVNHPYFLGPMFFYRAERGGFNKQDALYNLIINTWTEQKPPSVQQ